MKTVPDLLDDASLVRLAQTGDGEAFAELFRRHHSSVRRMCARRMGTLEAADEIAQAAFVRAYERIHQCTGEARFGGWVQVIARRMCTDDWRARQRLVPVEEVVADDVGGVFSCEDALARAEQAMDVRRALATLPPRQRDVVVARDVAGRRPVEIAAALALSVGAVDSLLLRARRRLSLAFSATGTEAGATSASLNAAAAVASTTTTAGHHLQVLARLAEFLHPVATNPAVAGGATRLAPRVAGVAVAAGLLFGAPSDTPTVPALPARPPAVAIIVAPVMPEGTTARLPSAPELPTSGLASGLPGDRQAGLPGDRQAGLAGDRQAPEATAGGGVADSLSSVLGGTGAPAPIALPGVAATVLPAASAIAEGTGADVLATAGTVATAVAGTVAPVTDTVSGPVSLEVK